MHFFRSNDHIYHLRISLEYTDIHKILHGSGSVHSGLNGTNDDARLHEERITHEKYLELGWSVLLHSPYSANLVPTFLDRCKTL